MIFADLHWSVGFALYEYAAVFLSTLLPTDI